MHKLLQLLRFFSVSFFFVIYGHASIVTPIPIDINSTINGEWTESSGLSSNSGNFANYYTFTLLETKDISIGLKGFSKRIYLLDSNNSIIDTSYMIGYDNDAIIIQTLEAGTYKIDVSADYRDQVGSYILSLNENIIENTQLNLNSTIDDVWTSSSGYSPISKRRTRYYTFTLLESKEVIINSVSNNYMRLYLLDSNATILEKYNFSKNPRMVKTLEPGTYTIDVSIADNNLDMGSFTLYLRENIVNNSSIEINSSSYGEWTNLSGVSTNSNHYANYYTFNLTEKKNIVIDINTYMDEVESYHDTILYLLDSNNSIIETVAGGSRTDTRIERTLEAGIYTIDVSTFATTTTGNFILNFNENVISNTNILLNSFINGEWTNNSGISPRSKHYTNYYTFTLDEKKDIIIDLNSDSAYSKIYLLDENNDSIEGNSRLVRKLEAGTYTIDATTDYYSELARFTLNLRENIVSTEDIIFNKTVHGKWLNTSGVSSRSGGLANYYIFTLAEKKEVTMKVKSNSWVGLYLLDKNNDIITSVSSYSNNNNIEIVRVLEAGTYKIDVTTYYLTKELGDYIIQVNADVSIPNQVNQVKTIENNPYLTTITWENNDTSTVGYRIYRDGLLVADINASENNYILSGLNPNNDYTYSVIAYNSAGESEAVSGTFKTKKDDYAWLVPVQYNILN